MKKVAIVDDETPARDLLREYLNDYPSLVIIGEANNGVDATRLINEFQPEIVFLDIQMPGMTGFDVIQKLKVMPQIIFSTAYDEYALKAFEVNAVDYLLKPYTKERFGTAVEKVLDRESEDANLKNLAALTETLLKENQKTSYPDRILVALKNKLIVLAVKDVIRVEADKDYSTLITASRNYLSNYGIGKMAEKLNPETFIRVHRSSIINVNFIQEIIKYPSSYDVKLKNDDVVRVSRSYLDNIRNLTF